eukprot:TRINITY_DN6945_c0_g1_i2.p1 TRINITY_DN6945_c0_g1~~TRINITY_DN6945_c0_g1_i2.p1  ORF type:complete len:247 (-),score=26.84 TRINITY_DN6945_c0_g1_i2:122-862(-)
MLFCFSCTTPTEGGGRRGYGGVPSVLDEDVVALRRRRGRVGNASMIWTGLFWSWSVTGVSVCLLIVLAFLHSVLFIAKKSCQMRRAYVFCAVVWTLVYIYTLLMMPENWALRAGMFLHEGEYVSEVLITEWSDRFLFAAITATSLTVTVWFGLALHSILPGLCTDTIKSPPSRALDAATLGRSLQEYASFLLVTLIFACMLYSFSFYTFLADDGFFSYFSRQLFLCPHAFARVVAGFYSSTLMLAS